MYASVYCLKWKRIKNRCTTKKKFKLFENKIWNIFAVFSIFLRSTAEVSQNHYFCRKIKLFKNIVIVNTMWWKNLFLKSAEKAHQTSSTGKVMATEFWDAMGVLLVEFMKPGTKIIFVVDCDIKNKYYPAQPPLSVAIWFHVILCKCSPSSLGEHKTSSIQIKHFWSIIQRIALI